MKKIYLTLIVAFLFTSFTFGQTLMSDEDHRMMMNTYEINLNTVLTDEMPQGMTMDQFKKNIVNGTATLSSAAQTNITNYATPLLTYGSDFATAKGLTATTDAYKYFFSSFAPSTVVQNRKLVESTTTAGITATEMWTCALESFNTDDCGLSALVSDKSNLNTLTNTCVNRLAQYTNALGVLVMLADYKHCLNIKSGREGSITYFDPNKNIKINYTAELSKTETDSTLTVKLSINDNETIFDYGSMEINSPEKSDILQLSAMLKANYSRVISLFNIDKIQLHSTVIDDMAIKMSNTYSVKEKHSLAFQGIYMFQSILNGTKRDINGNGRIAFTPYEGYKANLSSFSCEEEIQIDKIDFNNYIEGKKITNPEDQGIEYYEATLARMNKENFTLFELNSELNIYLTSMGGIPFNSSQCGCCGNYGEDMPCLYWHRLCFLHDYQCQRCIYKEYCLDGCRVSSCSGEGTLLTYRYTLLPLAQALEIPY